MTTTNTVDAARVELLLSELRLPTFKLMWAKLAEQSDKEGWPAARFLAALAEHEMADPGRRRIERHLAEARLPAGKTLATFDFEAVPMVSYHFHSGMNRRWCGVPVGIPHGSVDMVRYDQLIRRGSDGQVQQRPIDAVETSPEAGDKSDDAAANPNGVTARKRNDAARDFRSNGGVPEYGEPGPYGL